MEGVGAFWRAGVFGWGLGCSGEGVVFGGLGCSGDAGFGELGVEMCLNVTFE